MTYIEDIVVSLTHQSFLIYQASPWEKSFLNSVGDQIVFGQPLTARQATAILRILKKNVESLKSTYSTIDFILENPQYRFPLREIVNAKHISLVDDPTFKKIIKVVFPFDQKIVDLLRKGREQLNANWNADEKFWSLNFSEGSIKFLEDHLPDFTWSEDLNVYKKQVGEILGNMDSYVPMISLENSIPVYKNAPVQVPPLQSTEIIPALFESKLRGISTWSEEINRFLENTQISPILLDFLKNDANHFNINSDTEPVTSIAPLIQYARPCLFVIPAGGELEHLTKIYNLLMSQGYDPKNISVMFRLPGISNNKFNTFIKEQGLNNPISENTEFVFISGKIPKPLLKSKIKFNLTVNLGYLNVHYTLRDYMRNCQNLVYYTNSNPLRNNIFVNL